MTTAATRETGALARSDVIACIPHLRAFAVVLVGDRQRADDLVRDTIVQTFTSVNQPSAGVQLKVRMFAALRRQHYSVLRLPLDDATQQREPRAGKEDGGERDELLRIFGRLRDEHREALILAIASGLSYGQAAEVCDCRIDTFRIRVLAARRELSRMLRQASQEREVNFQMLEEKRTCESFAHAICAEQELAQM